MLLPLAPPLAIVPRASTVVDASRMASPLLSPCNVRHLYSGVVASTTQGTWPEGGIVGAQHALTR